MTCAGFDHPLSTTLADPKFFQLMLNWLRDGWCLLPSSPEERMELLHEVRFLQLGGMDAWIRSQQLVSSPIRGPVLSPGGPLPTVAYTGIHNAQRPGKTHVSDRLSVTNHTMYIPAVDSPAGSPSRPLFAAPLPSSPQPRLAGLLAPTGSPAHSTVPASPPPAASSSPGFVWPQTSQSLRATFLEATAAAPAPSAAPAYSIAQGGEEAKSKWTAKYLRTNEGLREVRC